VGLGGDCGRKLGYARANAILVEEYVAFTIRGRIWGGQPIGVAEAVAIPTVEQFDADVWVELAESSNLSVLPGDKALPHGRQFDVELVLG
jgi:hypothetical protein